ncbi:MAG: hypothetical protein D6726_03875 [Nitrospirae bacterium]|nr:MAG: hypothetical protein D6726_03875 [Nitrospirota bacterium]
MLLKRVNNQSGVALIAALSISLILMVVAIAISYNVGIFSRATTTVERKDQNLFSASYGMEDLRYYLWESWCPPPRWGGVNGNFCSDGTGDDNDLSSTAYSSVMSGILNKEYNSAHWNVVSPSSTDFFVKLVGNIFFFRNSEYNALYSYDIYAKKSNNPEILYALVSSVKSSKAFTETSESEFATRTTVEAAIHFSVPCPDDYKQFGQCKSKEGETDESVQTTGSLQLP